MALSTFQFRKTACPFGVGLDECRGNKKGSPGLTPGSLGLFYLTADYCFDAQGAQRLDTGLLLQRLNTLDLPTWPDGGWLEELTSIKS